MLKRAIALAASFLPSRSAPRRMGALAPVLDVVAEKLDAVNRDAPERPAIHCEVPRLSPAPTFKPVRGRKPSAVRRILEAQAAETAAAIKRLSMPVAPLFNFVSPKPFAPPTPPDKVARYQRRNTPEDRWHRAGRVSKRATAKAALPPPQKPPEQSLAVAVAKVATTGKRPAKAARKRSGGKRKAGSSDATPKMQPRLAAAAWLGQRVKDGPVDYAAIKTEAPKAGHSLRTLDRAAALIDVESVEIGGGRTVWQMRAAK